MKRDTSNHKLEYFLIIVEQRTVSVEPPVFKHESFEVSVEQKMIIVARATFKLEPFDINIKPKIVTRKIAGVSRVNIS